MSAAMAAMIAIMSTRPGDGRSILQLMAVTVPSAVIGITLTAILISRFGGADLDNPSRYRPEPKVGIESLKTVSVAVTPRGRASAIKYLPGVLAVVPFGLMPELRPTNDAGASRRC